MPKITEAEKAAQQLVLDMLLAEKSPAGEFARQAAEALPSAVALQYLPKLAALMTETMTAVTGDVLAVEIDGARVAMDRVEYPSGIVHLDGSGDLMRVEFERPATPEFAEVGAE